MNMHPSFSNSVYHAVLHSIAIAALYVAFACTSNGGFSLLMKACTLVLLFLVMTIYFFTV